MVETAVNFLINMQREPWRFDYFTVLRHLERNNPDKPRIGDSAVRQEEFAHLGQDAFMDFPASNLARAEENAGKPIKLFFKFLGLLGPQGALPLATTEEAYHYVIAQDDAFPRFLDIFNHRFLQLFFRAWADSRPIVQHDRPELDRFIAYIGSAIGVGSAPYRDLDSIPDAVKLGYAGLLGAQAKSASRLAAAIRGLFGVEVEIDEFVGTWLQLEGSGQTMLGSTHAVLGQDVLLGKAIFSVQDKIRIRVFANSLDQYARFLPTGDLCEPLADLVFFYIGEQLEWDAELAIHAGAVAPMRLGKSGQIGWTSWMAPNWSSSDKYRRDARFHPSDRMRQKREQQSKQESGRGGSNGRY
jgi:type VI secretion system protein ImpH